VSETAGDYSFAQPASTPESQITWLGIIYNMKVVVPWRCDVLANQTFYGSF